MGEILDGDLSICLLLALIALTSAVPVYLFDKMLLIFSALKPVLSLRFYKFCPSSELTDW